ncbi:MAG TPA: serine hydrolase domain-containing protein [Candidatus Limnocylindrales bacterium]
MALAGVASLVAMLLAPAAAAVESTGASTSLSTGFAAIVARYQERIPALMATESVPGVAVALVGSGGDVWTEGFGHVDGPDSAPVTPGTIFSLQSTSKTFTATAVMAAVGAGRVDLDAPITTYLPEFTAHSAFETHPERKMTLRMLLAHTAGFTHEAPIGNNNELDAATFDEHVASISDTWLRFPVGTGYAYSNLGIDLAGFILERVYGMPFADVMRETVLAPIGMNRSTFDRAAIRAATDRAIGHSPPLPSVPVDVPMMAAGGLYSSAADLARFLRFEIDNGSIDERVVVDPTLMTEMRQIPPPTDDGNAGYALGVGRTRWVHGRNADLFNHGGGGFGFLSDLWWAPDVGVGIAVLTNSDNHHLQGDLAISILNDLIDEPGIYHDRVLTLPDRAGPAGPETEVVLPDAMPDLIARAAMRPDGNEATRWAGYVGQYRVSSWGVISPDMPTGQISVVDGVLRITGTEDGATFGHRLTELSPGLFIADNGETLDMRTTPPTWRNFELIRAAGAPALWQWAILGIGAAVGIAWMALAVIRGVGAVRRRRPNEAPAAGTRPWRSRSIAVALIGGAVVVATLGSIAVLAAMPGLVDSGFIGWLELPLAMRLALHLPLVVAVAAVALSFVTAVGWRRHWWSGAVRGQYAGLSVAALLVAGQLAAWHLIGWGLS